MDKGSTGAAERVSGGAGLPHAHDSAQKQVTGEARYIDDLPEPAGLLHIQVGLSARAHAKLAGLDLSRVRKAPGVVAVLTAADVPGINDASPFAGDDPIFASEVVEYAGQPLFAVVAESREQAVMAALGQANVELPAGDLVRGNTAFPVRVGHLLRDVDQVCDVVIAVDGDRPIHLRDIASANDGPATPTHYVEFLEAGATDFEPAVTIAIAKRAGTNAATIAETAMHRVDELTGSVLGRGAYVRDMRGPVVVGADARVGWT